MYGFGMYDWHQQGRIQVIYLFCNFCGFLLPRYFFDEELLWGNV